MVTWQANSGQLLSALLFIYSNSMCTFSTTHFSIECLDVLWTEIVPLDMNETWLEAWDLATVVNHFRMMDSTIQQTGYNCPRWTWCELKSLLHFSYSPLCCKSTQVGLSILGQLWMSDGLNNVSQSKWMSKDNAFWRWSTNTSLFQHWHNQLVGTKGDKCTREMNVFLSRSHLCHSTKGNELYIKQVAEWMRWFCAGFEYEADSLLWQ